jgi:hypothetical protein
MMGYNEQQCVPMHYDACKHHLQHLVGSNAQNCPESCQQQVYKNPNINYLG